MTADVTVLTTCHPPYTGMLADCVASIAAQTVQPAYHRVSIDFRGEGPVPQLNDLARGVTTEWATQMAADDVADPHHLETMLAHADGADIVYPWCRVVGRVGWNPNAHFDPERLERENYIPAVALIQTDLLRELGWWNPDSLHAWEDWDLWRRALAAGAVFRCVPEVTWTYRFDHGMNATFHGFPARAVRA